MSNRKWTYKGNIATISQKKNLRGEWTIDEIELYDISDDSKAPILLHCGAGLFGYIMDIEGHDDEERYMVKEFVYDDILCLRKIRILNKDGQVCKIIEDNDDLHWTATITGPLQRINDRNQRALDRDEETHIVGPESFTD